METYSEYRDCPKCGSKLISTGYDRFADLMTRRCERCRYQWNEAPINRGPK